MTTFFDDFNYPDGDLVGQGSFLVDDAIGVAETDPQVAGHRVVMGDAVLFGAQNDDAALPVDWNNPWHMEWEVQTDGQNDGPVLLYLHPGTPAHTGAGLVLQFAAGDFAGGNLTTLTLASDFTAEGPSNYGGTVDFENVAWPSGEPNTVAVQWDGTNLAAFVNSRLVGTTQPSSQQLANGGFFGRVEGGRLSFQADLTQVGGSGGTISVLSIEAINAALEVLSLRERIEREIVRLMSGISGIGKVYRWDARGPRDPATGLGVDGNGARLAMQALDAMVILDDEQTDLANAGGGTGGAGSDVTLKVLPAEIHVILRQDEADPEVTEKLHDQWVAAVEAAMLVNPTLIEGGVSGGGARLAVDVRVLATSKPPREPGQREVNASVRFEITYRHFRSDPASGPGITAAFG